MSTTTANMRYISHEEAHTDNSRLAFERHYPQRSAAVTLHYRGVPVNVTLNDASADAVEKLIDSMLAREGWAAPQVVSAPATPANGKPAKAKAERVTPFYDDQGTACCPKHRKPLKQGQWGLYCPAKDDSTERGYCALKFEE